MTIKVCECCRCRLRDEIKGDAERLGIDPDVYLNGFVEALEKIMEARKNESI